MAGSKRTTRAKSERSAPAKRSSSPDKKPPVLTKQQFSKLSSAVVKDYAVHNNLDPNMSRKDIASALFGADETILAGHRMNWSAPWTPQNASTSLPAGPSIHESNIETSQRRLRNGEISDPAEQHAVKSEVISAALLHSIASTNEAARRMLQGSGVDGEGSQAQPLVVDVEAPRVNHTLADHTTSAGAETRISAASQNSYPSPAVSALGSPSIAPLAESLPVTSTRQGNTHAPVRPSKLGLGKRTRDDDQSDDDNSMQEGETEDGLTKRPAKQQRRTATIPAPALPESSNAGDASPTPPTSPRLTAAQKGKGKALPPPLPTLPRPNVHEPVHAPPASDETNGPVRVTISQTASIAAPSQDNLHDDEVDLSEDIAAAHAAAPTGATMQPPSVMPTAAPGPSNLHASHDNNGFHPEFIQAAAIDTYRKAINKLEDVRRFQENVGNQTELVRGMQVEAQERLDAAKGRIDNASVILGLEAAKRNKGLTELDTKLKQAVSRDAMAYDLDAESLSEDELEPMEVLLPQRGLARPKASMYTHENEKKRAAREWWTKRMEWKALHRANKGPKTPEFTAKDAPKLVQAQRKRAIKVLRLAMAARNVRIMREQPTVVVNGEVVDRTSVAVNEPLAPCDFAGIAEDEDAKDPENDGWRVVDWLSAEPRDWSPQVAERKAGYFLMY
ncbi:hypothetical protein PENSPDRAFT_668250 [Peniophora sp. CONT]|nr:hypothetical protein PENSPDRAFT_668250 [Peniophora sp. CONT]